MFIKSFPFICVHILKINRGTSSQPVYPPFQHSNSFKLMVAESQLRNHSFQEHSFGIRVSKTVSESNHLVVSKSAPCDRTSEGCLKLTAANQQETSHSCAFERYKEPRPARQVEKSRVKNVKIQVCFNISSVIMSHFDVF